MLTQFMEMMKIVEENRKASEDRLLALLSTQPQRNETLYRVMPDFSQTIDNFDGEALGERAMDWLASLESTAILHTKSGRVMGKNEEETPRKKREYIFFFHDKVTLCKALDYDFVETKEQVLVGLYNKQIIPGLVTARAENVDDLLHEIVDFDRITEKAQNTQKGNMQKFVNRSNPVSNGRTNLVKNANVKEEFTSDSTRLPARDDQNRPLCFISKDCPVETRKEVSSPDSPLAQLIVEKEDKNIDRADKYLRDIDINGKKVKALIDPGSAVCTIKEDIVREKKLMCEPTNEKFFSGTRHSPTTDVLLGRSFTDIPTVAYVKIENSLYFGQEDEPLFCNLEWGDIPNKKTITVASSVTLLKNQINFIQVQGDNHERWLPVMNFSKDVVSLEKGQKLGEFRQFATPRNKHELKRFLGLTGFFRRFVEKYALTAKPLTDLTRAEREYKWTKDQEYAFQKFKSMLQGSPTLQLYNPKATALHCNASIYGIAGMLLQEGEDRKLHLLELLAILWSVERLRHLLLGIKFTVVSDCQALVYLNAKKTVQPQIARWYSILAEYDMEIKYRPGDRMSLVDCLSRAATEEPSNSEIIEKIYEKRLNIFLIIPEDGRILMMQMNKEENNLVQNYEIDRERLYKKVKVNDEERWLYVIPDSMRKATVIKYHDQMDHWSLDRTATHILKKFWFRGLRRYVRQHIRGCFECLLANVPGGRKSDKLHSPRLPERPMIKLHVDHLGLFLKSTKGNQHILVIVDAYTFFIRLYPVKSTKSIETSQKMKEFINQYGAPRIIVSDQGTTFTGHSFTEFCKKYDIEHKTIASHYPQANGMVENRMKSIIPVIVTSFDFDDEQWDKTIYRAERKINTAVNKTLGCSPFECLYGYTPTYEDASMKVRSNVAKSQNQSRAYYDITHSEGVKYEIGDIVAIKRVPTYTGEPTKTQLKYRGPLVVIEVLPSDCYCLERLNNEDGGKIFMATLHVSQMKIYKNHEDDDNTNYDSESTENDEEDVTVEVEKESEEPEIETGPESDENDKEWEPEQSESEVKNASLSGGRPKWKIRRPLRYDDFV
ncbi:hypothetical protein NQ314_005016 [Rhamnusium bicolor]|uniref:RNA-directed DNA polymerase n=1 Tax=Rhamnusium bicolor TaxID=1586634 RepID=A0AAV8ZJS3_9CUCU|nr:hypothetical protein NQ314_005016 [Rhamnusium bicolor]